MSQLDEISEAFNEATAPDIVAPDCDVLLIDLSSLFYPAWHASADTDIGRAFEDTLFSVGKLRAIPHKYLAICCDHPPYWRKEVSPSYKAQRDTPSQAMVEQFRRVRERLARDGLLVWRCEGFEADDVIATAASTAVAEGMTVTIATGDKDLMQLVNDSTRVYSVNKRETSGPREVFEKFGVPPSKVRDWLALCGDKSDNIPGVPGVGPKTAAQLLSIFDNGHNVIESAKRDDERIKPAARKALAAHEGFDLAFRLIGLRYDAPIEFNDLFEERKPEPLESKEYDMNEPEEAEYEEEEKPQPGPPAAIEKPREETRPVAPSEALAPVTSFEMQLEPTTMAKALTMADVLMNSRLYPRMQNKESIFAIVVRGREMGLGALTALDCMQMVEGRPTMSAHLIVARAKQHPDCEYFQMLESTDQVATYETKARHDPKATKHSYTYAQAVQAGVAPAEPRKLPIVNDKGKDGRGQWEKRPAEMLRKTAAVQLARIVYPDAALGLYATEEMDPEAS